MAIAWKYIDKAAATIAALCDYTNMQSILDITPPEIKRIRGKMTGPRAAKIGAQPKSHNPGDGENVLISALDTLDVLRERYAQALEYMAWFDPAWRALSDEEKTILREYYMTGSMRSGAAARLQDRLNYSDRQVERLRHKSLSRLSILLYGK